MSITNTDLWLTNSHARTPTPYNEPNQSYASGSTERASITATLRRMSSEQIELPLFIGGDEVRTNKLRNAVMPHRHTHVLGHAHQAGSAEVRAAINAANEAAPDWASRHWSKRAAVFLKAADMLSGAWRNILNAATMLGQSKTVHQAEIDSAAELLDFWRFNIEYMQHIYNEQPLSPKGVWNQVDYRPLEGFVYAVTPFNFTAIAGNLPTAPALMGNTVVWKPASTAMYSAQFLMRLLREAGLPDGVINLVYGNGADVSDIALSDSALAGVHFTGSTEVFNGIMQTVAQNLGHYRGYPRIVGETGGKNFIVAHGSADVPALTTAIIRGAFEYQGQKCSAVSRAFVPQSLWSALRERLCDEIGTIRMGDVTDLTNFMGAVIDEKAWDKHAAALDEAAEDANCNVLAGGDASKEEGYFVEPTLIETTDFQSRLLREELFGPIVTVYIYPDKDFEPLLRNIDETSHYALTGAIFARDRQAVTKAVNSLRNSAGNFYINDKPTGSIVGQQPFGGARASGTNDKAGSIWNLIRWVSPRTIKENFVPPTDYRYPFMQSDH